MAAAGGEVAAAGNEGQGQGGWGNIPGMMMQFAMLSMAMNFFTRSATPEPSTAGNSSVSDIGSDARQAATDRKHQQVQMRNLFGPMEECELFVHWSLHNKTLSLPAALNDSLAAEGGWQPLWRTRVWYEATAPPEALNMSLGPFPDEVLAGEVEPYLHALLVRLTTLEAHEDPAQVEDWQVVSQSVPMVVKLRELDSQAGAANLFGGLPEESVVTKNSSQKVTYFKTKLEIRPVFDQMVHNMQTVGQGPFKNLRLHPERGLYDPYLYLSDFWLLEKDYLPLNETMVGEKVNLSLSYSVIAMWSWSIQAQMAEQWMVQGAWSLSDTQRDAFMMKRLYLDTNPYLLAFSGAFIMLHTLFSMLAFKNDVQFWRNNQSMKGLSARSMVVSFVCQLITALYLLDSQETSRLILFEIVLDLGLGTWKLRKAINIQPKRTFPFVQFGGQKGYEDRGTSKYDEEALRYVCAVLTPVFIGYCIRSALYGKHRSWYSFFVGAAAGGVYTFGFVMMTPQLYINYKLQSVEHLPWRALTYKSMNTFVDDIAAFLIDMPLMHRLSCFRDDIVFFVYIYQRWKYSVDKSRAGMWGSGEEPEGAADAAPAVAPIADAKDAGGAAVEAARPRGQCANDGAQDVSESAIGGEMVD